MEASVHIEYAGIYILLCLVAGAVYASILYFKKHLEISKRLRFVLASLRFILVSLLCYFLLEPFLEYVSEKGIKPKVLLVVDNSESIKLAGDSAVTAAVFNEIRKELKEKVDVIPVHFSDKVNSSDSLSFSGALSNIQQGLTDCKTLYEGANINALVLLTDGVQNQGVEDFSQETWFNKLLVLGVGDTTQRKDLVLKKLYTNPVTYKGNIYPVELEVVSKNLKGKSVVVKLFQNDSLVKEWNWRCDKPNGFKSFVYSLEAKKAGYDKIRAQIVPVEDEATLKNNTQTQFVKVVDERKKILIVYDVPHPDIGAFKSVFINNQSYQLESRTFSEWNPKDQKHDLVVLFKLPSNPSQLAAAKNVLSGPKQNYLLFLQNQTPYRELVTGQRFSNSFDNAQASLNSKFDLFQVDKDMKAFEDCPPLSVPFGVTVLNGEQSIVAYQKIGKVTTQKPLISIVQKGAQKIGLIGGEGIWRWRLNTLKDDNKAFEHFMEKMVALLANPVDKSLLRMNFNRSIYENEKIVFNASYRNQANELSNEKDLELRLVNLAGEEYPYTFSKLAKSYRLSVDRLTPGVYTVKSKLLGTKEQFAHGKLLVKEFRLEAEDLTANHDLLKGIASVNKGAFYHKSEKDQLINALKSQQFQELSYSIKEYKELIKLKWLLFVLVLLLATEWSIRKKESLV